MKLKDKEFDLLGTRYKLIYEDKIPSLIEGNFTMGVTNTGANEIHIATQDYHGNPVDSSEHKITLIHELLHAILDEGQYNDASGDEPMIEWLARCLKSLMDQKII